MHASISSWTRYKHPLWVRLAPLNKQPAGAEATELHESDPHQREKTWRQRENRFPLCRQKIILTLDHVLFYSSKKVFL
jgi:hypothetical protein